MKPTKNFKDLRKKLRTARRALSALEREEKSLAIFRYLSEYPPFQRAKSLAIYWATDEEVATSSTIDYANRNGKSIYLPIVNKVRHPKGMYFHRYIRGETVLELNSFGIAEPRQHPQAYASSENLDVILVPLVGFNQNLDRIGMGGGHYDRSLSKLNNRSTRFIGLAFACQKAEFEPMPHDVRLHAIITEEGILANDANL